MIRVMNMTPMMKVKIKMTMMKVMMKPMKPMTAKVMMREVNEGDDDEANDNEVEYNELGDDEANDKLFGEASGLNIPEPIVIVTESPHPPPKTKDTRVPYPSLLPPPDAKPLPNKGFDLWPSIKSINHELDQFSKSTKNVIFLNPADVFVKIDRSTNQERMVNNRYMNKYYPSPQGYAVWTRYLHDRMTEILETQARG
mmetsp:Transcript_31858/g.38749  ORF Transcript_31858/g.38749 Transcript_31858/m.38749 type:complete len:198 (-) Transcript_31858:178-771(-)